jgi:hypothetical protein
MLKLMSSAFCLKSCILGIDIRCLVSCAREFDWLPEFGAPRSLRGAPPALLQERHTAATSRCNLSASLITEFRRTIDPCQRLLVRWLPTRLGCDVMSAPRSKSQQRRFMCGRSSHALCDCCMQTSHLKMQVLDKGRWVMRGYACRSYSPVAQPASQGVETFQDMSDS